MSSPSKQRNFTIGKLQIATHDFANAGDILAWHTHGKSDAHITIVGMGCLKMEHGKNADKTETETQYISQGMCVDTAPGIWHEFIALTPAKIFNIAKEPE